MKIRKYQEKDKKNLQYICVATAKPTNSQAEKDVFTTLYNDYFTECENDNIFVATNGDDDAIGYILCSTDFKKYKKAMREVYLPKVWLLNKAKWLLVHLELIIESYYSKKYPAFLHIDILDAYQRMGLGHKLMDALISQLRKAGVSGVMLGVSAKNEKGINFYKKYGFKTIKQAFGTCKMVYIIE